MKGRPMRQGSNLTLCFAILALPLLAACQSAPAPQPVAVDDGFGVDACGAAELQDMVGEPKSILETMKFAVPVRVIEPGMAVTADYSPDRLNFEIAEDGTIAKIACY
jgi:Peptidase inhibitor I78 family